MRILHLADLHLGAPHAYLGEMAAVRARDFEEAFSDSVSCACDPSNHVDLVAIAGDLFDSPHPKPELLGLVIGGLRDLAQKGIATILVPGTHDSHLSTDSAYKEIVSLKGTHVITAPAVGEPFELQIGDERAFFYGAAYDPCFSGDPFGNLRAVDQPGIHVAVLHASLEGSPMWEYREKDMLLSRETIASSGMSYVALGHYHNFQSGTLGCVAYCYPGTLEGRRFGEDGPRYRVIAELSSAGCILHKEKCNRRTLDVRTVDMSLCSIGSDAELIEYLSRQADPNLILRVSLKGTSSYSPSPSVVQEALAGDFFHLEVEDSTAMVGSEWIEQVSREPGVAGAFVRRLLRRISEAEASGDLARAQVLQEALKVGLAAFGR